MVLMVVAGDAANAAPAQSASPIEIWTLVVAAVSVLASGFGVWLASRTSRQAQSFDQGFAQFHKAVEYLGADDAFRQSQGVSMIRSLRRARWVDREILELFQRALGDYSNGRSHAPGEGQ